MKRRKPASSERDEGSLGQRAVPADARLVVGESRTATVPFTALLIPERRIVTLLLWVLSFANLLNLYFLANWLPLLSVRMGYAKSTSVLMGTLLQCGGLVGAVALGHLIDRLGFFLVLSVVFAIAALGVGCIGTPEIPFLTRLALILLSGVCIVGTQPAINALAAIAYPTEIRASGVGWALGVGRAGSIVGPLVTARICSPCSGRTRHSSGPRPSRPVCRVCSSWVLPAQRDPSATCKAHGLDALSFAKDRHGTRRHCRSLRSRVSVCAGAETE